MAHGFLSYTQVSGDNFWKNLKDVYKGLRDLARLYDTGNKILKANVRVLDPKQLAAGTQKALPSGAPKALAAAPQTKMLGAGAGALAKRDGGLVEKNPTNIDVKTGNKLPPGGPRLPGGPSRGGGFTNIPGISSGGLNTENFFSKAVGYGVNASTGQYLSREDRIAAFKAGRVERGASQGPAISPDSGADIVAAVNRNTQMIVSLVDATKAQTTNDSNLVQRQIQAQETLLSRSTARAEEAALEEGNDLSGFMTPENFKKKEKQEKKKEDKDKGSKLKDFFRGPNPFKKKDDCCGCGCSPFMPGPGGGGGILGGPPGGGGGGLPIPDYTDQWRDMNRRPGRGGGASVKRRAGGARRLTRLATKIGGKSAGKAVSKGLGKMGLKKVPVLGALAGGAFAAERAMKGDWLGAGGELLSGVASIFPGIGTGISAAIDAGLMARDAGLTPFAEGGIVTNPIAGLVGEAGNEGVFPLEGTRGKKTFQMFGEGIFAAQKDNKDEYAKIQASGMKQYFEKGGGWKSLTMFLGPVLGTLVSGLGSVLGSLAGGAANAGEMPGDFTGSSGQDQAMNYFMSQGLTKEQAAGIVGNLMQESTAAIDPMANNGTHRGIAQWDKNRWANFEKFAKKKGLDVNSREAQLQWIMEEMRTGSGGLGIERFKKTKTAAEAAALFVKDYERSGEKPGEAGYDKRISNATALASKDISGGGAAPSQAGLPQLPPTGHMQAQKYGAGRRGGRKHAGTDFDISGNETFVSRIGGEVINVSYDPSGYGKYADIYNSQLGVTERIAEGAQVLVKVGQKISPGTPVARGETDTGVIHYEIRKGRGGFGFSGTLDPVAFLRNAGSSQNVAQKPGGSGTPAVANRRGQGSTGGALQASAANANSGTGMMAASQDVAMGAMGLTSQGGSPTIINNYYGGGQGGGGFNSPNSVANGIGMDGTGTSIFQDLRIRALS